MIHTGEELKQKRIALGLSQARLAELTGLSQFVLSAFELGKTSIDETLLATINDKLNDNSRVEQLVKRKKRYQKRIYNDVSILPERELKAFKSERNEEYTKLLNKLADRHNKKQYSCSAISLFAGCGGLSYGFSSAGFEIKGYLELDQSLRHIFHLNFPEAIEMGSDITMVSNEQIIKHHGNIGDIDVIIGGPPCQGFSLAGKRKVDDPRNTLFMHYLRFVRVFKPKVALMENVRVLTSMKTINKTLVKDEICKEFDNLGYSVRFFEVDAKDYGVPEHRERVIFIAVRKDLNIEPSIPPKTHCDTQDLFNILPKCRSFADACSDLPYIEAGGKSSDPMHFAIKHPQHVIDWLWDVEEGKSAHDNVDPQKRPPSGYNTTYKRQVWLEPASTVQTTFGMISGCRNVHPIATRSLTIREAARIQSFPDSFIFDGQDGTIRTGIGNAVPPLLAYAMAIYIKKTFLKLVEVTTL